MTNVGDLFGFPGEVNETPFDPATLDAQLDRIMATRPIPGAPEGYVSPHPQGVAPDGTPAGAVPGAAPPAAPPVPAPPPFHWDSGVSMPYPGGQPPGPPAAPPTPPAAPPAQPGSPPVPPAAPAAPPAPPAPPAAPPVVSFWDSLSPLEQQELMLTHQALRDPDRQAGVRQAYIGGAPPAAPPSPLPGLPAAGAPPAAPPGPAPLPEGILEGTPEAQMWSMQQEHERQLREIRESVSMQNQATEADKIKAAAEAAGTKFSNKYGRMLSEDELRWVAQMAGYQGLPDAFRAANPRLSYEDSMTQALEFQLRSTDQLLTKVLSAPPAPPPVPPGMQPAPGIPAPPAQPPGAGPPMVYPGQTPEADARHRYLTALSSAASPSGEVVQRQPIQHRPDGKIDEKSRFSLIQEMTSGGVMGELMGPNG